MKKIIIALLLLILGFVAPACLSPSTRTANAMFAGYTDADLVQNSSLIVTGKMLGQTPVTLNKAKIKLNLGVVQVTQVLKGDPAQTLALLELPDPAAPRSSTSLTYQAGQSGLWFLHPRTPKDTGIYRADHPQRFLPNATLEQVEQFQQLIRQ